MSLERQVVVGLKWGLTAKLLTQIVAWAVTLLVIRLLVPSDYGLMALASVVVSIFAGIAELGLGASLIQARTVMQNDLARVAGALLVLNGACGAIVVVAAPLFAEVFGHPRLELIVQVSSARFLLGALAAIPEALGYRDLRFRWLAATDIASGLAASTATLVLALFGAGVWALVWGGLAGQTVRTATLILGSKFVRPSFALSGIGQLVRFGGAWSAARFAWQLTYQTDVLIAGRFLGQGAVGIYAVAAQLANLPLEKTMGIVNQVAFPAIAKLQEELPRMRHRMLGAIRLLGFCAIPILWGVGSVAPEFVDVVLGDQWQAVILPLQLIAIVAPLRILATLFATAISALGRADVELVNTLMSLVAFVGALLVGVRWGVDGLAGAYAGAVTLSFLLTFPRTARIVGIPLREIFVTCRSSVVCGVAMLTAVGGARFALDNIPEWLRLAILTGLGAAVYVGTLFALDRAIWTDARKVVAALREPS